MQVSENRWNVELGHGLGILELGLSRSELLRRLEEAGIEFEAEDEDPHVYLTDEEIILTLSENDPAVLIQIAAEDERVQFGSKDVIGCKLHEIVELLQVREEETLWRVDDDPDESLPAAQASTVSSASNDDLLDGGTLWIKPLGLELCLWLGKIREIYLRLPEHSPFAGIGQLTSEQLDLSRRSDLVTHLKSAHGSQRQAKGCFRALSGLICFGLIAWVVWTAALYQRRWHQAPAAEGQVIAVRPDAPEQIPTEFIVGYRDQNGVDHQVTLTLADVNVPRAVGDKVDLRYLPEEPHKPLTPGRVTDVAFVKFFPWAIGIFAGYLALQIVGAIVGKLLRTPS